MNATAKQLIKAAKRVISNIPTADGRVVADHILSTVRPDDDEPVTRESMYGDDGWGFDPLEQEWKSLTINDVSVSFEDDDEAFLWTGSFYTPLKNMGHLRRLVAALGE